MDEIHLRTFNTPMEHNITCKHTSCTRAASCAFTRFSSSRVSSRVTFFFASAQSSTSLRMTSNRNEVILTLMSKEPIVRSRTYTRADFKVCIVLYKQINMYSSGIKPINLKQSPPTHHHLHITNQSINHSRTITTYTSPSIVSPSPSAHKRIIT